MALDQVDVDQLDKEMSFLDHVEELRWHIIRSVLVISSITIVAFFYPEWLFDKIIFGPKSPDFITYELLCKFAKRFGLDESFCITSINFKVLNTTLSGQLTQQIWISFMTGIVVAFPYIIWELWRFIKPALKNTERKYASGIIGYTSLLFLIGICFGYFILVPMSVNFLGNYQVSNEITNYIDLESYISFVSTLTVMTGLVFELPILVYFLSKIGILTPAFMRKYRRWAFVAILLIAAIVTPPDVVSQIIMTIPLYGLFEFSIFVSEVVERKKLKEEALSQ